MFKRCFSPLTLVNQLALIVMLSTAIGVAGMAVSGWLVQGVQGSAHAINKAGSLRMQSYRLLAAVPLDAKDQKLLDEMEQTAFSPERPAPLSETGSRNSLKRCRITGITNSRRGYSTRKTRTRSQKMSRALWRVWIAGDVVRPYY